MDITRESELLERLAPAVQVVDGTVRITDARRLRGEPIEALIRTAVFASDEPPQRRSHEQRPVRLRTGAVRDRLHLPAARRVRVVRARRRSRGGMDGPGVHPGR